MRRFRAIPFLIATVALAAVVAGGALAAAQTKVTFKGTYVGKVTEKVDGQDVTADPRTRDDLGPEGQAEDQRHGTLARLRRG